MKILGLNFGHDASLALYVNEKLVLFRELERYTRLKHTVGLKTDEISDFLSAAGLKISDIDFAAICGTQWYKIRHSKDIKITPKEPEEFIKEYKKKMCREVGFAKGIELGGTDNWYDYAHHANRFEKNLASTAMPIKFNCKIPQSFKISDMEKMISAAYKPTQNLLPYTIQISKVNIPALFVPHHVSHAYYGYEYNAFKNSIIISHDGGWPHIPLNSGGVFLPWQNELIAICDPRLYLGQIYQLASELAGFLPSEGPGKLMGLASYGYSTPELIDKLKTHFKSLSENESEKDFLKLRNNILEYIEKYASLVKLRQDVKKYDFTSLHKNSIGISTLTQSICETLWVDQLRQIVSLMKSLSPGTLEEIILVGGYSLNCPSNYKAQYELPQINILPLAGGTDMGTSIGAAKFATSLFSHNVMQTKRKNVISSAFPPRELRVQNKELNNLEIIFQAKESKVKKAFWYANELIKGKIFCHYDGQSEIGPRALGARSIIAHAINEKIRDVINDKKGRELWRPLAPMVSADKFNQFFTEIGNIEDGAACMLYNYIVKEPKKIPSCSHVDNTARVQICQNEFLLEVLRQLDFLGTVPVIINTSFNVAGEPIVETFNEAVKSFKKLGFDYLYCEKGIYK